jgi:hypothetical protein
VISNRDSGCGGEAHVKTIDAQGLADRYIAVWVEPDERLRRESVEALWARDGDHVLQPPVDIRERAADLGFDTSELRARGYDEIEIRVARSYDRFVAPGEFTFRVRQDAVLLADVVKFTWEMAPAGGGDAVGGGVEFLVLDDDGRIKTDYMFPGL